MVALRQHLPRPFNSAMEVHCANYFQMVLLRRVFSSSLAQPTYPICPNKKPATSSMFQASPPRHEAKLRSAVAIPHFNKLTVRLHDCQGEVSYFQTPPRRSPCPPAHDFGNRHVVVRYRREIVSKDTYRS